MKYCNLDCKYLRVNIIERCGDGLFYEYYCMAQKGMPKVNIDTYCPYGEISEAKIDELKGKWIRRYTLSNGNAQYECSNCHYGDEQSESIEVPYCWHCGAKMKKEIKNDN